jgi:protease-4
MKNFFTSMLGALVALVIFSGGCALLFVGLIAAIRGVGRGRQERAGVRAGFLSGPRPRHQHHRRTAPIDLASLEGGRERTVQLRTVTRALRAAAADSRVAGLFITGGLAPSGSGSGFAALKEVRAALVDFKASGKPITAYLTSATTKDYYLASAATNLAIDPYGLLVMPGLATEPMFYAGAFEKYGIGVQVTRVGKYKSAVEPYTRKDMSPENRTQLQKLLDDVWSGVLADIAPSRGLTPAKIQALVDREGLIRPEAALQGETRRPRRLPR